MRRATSAGALLLAVLILTKGVVHSETPGGDGKKKEAAKPSVTLKPTDLGIINKMDKEDQKILSEYREYAAKLETALSSTAVTAKELRDVQPKTDPQRFCNLQPYDFTTTPTMQIAGWRTLWGGSSTNNGDGIWDTGKNFEIKDDTKHHDWTVFLLMDFSDQQSSGFRIDVDLQMFRTRTGETEDKCIWTAGTYTFSCPKALKPVPFKGNDSLLTGDNQLRKGDKVYFKARVLPAEELETSKCHTTDSYNMLKLSGTYASQDVSFITFQGTGP